MRAFGLLLAPALVLVVFSGCERPEQAEADFQVEQRAAASRAGLTLERTREIVAQVARVPAEDVTVMHRSLEDRLATVLAAVPAADEMLGEDPLESVDLRWDFERSLPLHVLWSERLQFAPRQPVTPAEATEVARGLLDRWLPAAAPDTPPQPAEKLRAPIYVVNWAGRLDGHMTGDQAVVQVSSVTGLPISFSQRVAQNRPSPEEIAITRDRALEIVRNRLREAGVEDVSALDLVAQLSLSAEGHPDQGPAWFVAEIGPGGRQVEVWMVDAMTGDVLVREDSRAARSESGR